MIKVQRRFANFVDPNPEDLKVTEVDSLESLMALEWVAQITQSEGFSRWHVDLLSEYKAVRSLTGVSTATTPLNKAHLMVEFDDGSFFVVGMLDGRRTEIKDLGLPEWVRKRRE